MFLAGKALFLGCSDDVAVLQQDRLHYRGRRRKPPKSSLVYVPLNSSKLGRVRKNGTVTAFQVRNNSQRG